MGTSRVVTVLAMAGLLFTTPIGVAEARRLPDSPVGGAPLSADLDGQQEVDPVAGDLGTGDLESSGFAAVAINPGRRVACYELSYDLEPEPFAFHIHAGAAGENGPIVVDFFTDPDVVVPPQGCVDIGRELATEILRNPEGYYFNAHNTPFPAGAIRGQLSKTSRTRPAPGGEEEERSITFVGVTNDQTDFDALGIGTSGYWFPQFAAPAPAAGRPTGENDRDALPSWAGPLNHFSFADCDLILEPDECLEKFLTRTFSQDGPTTSSGGEETWNTFTLPSGEVGLSGAIVDPATIGNSNNTINRIQLGDGVPASFYFHIVTDNTNRQHDPTNRLRPRGNVGETDLDIEADVLLETSDLIFNGVADVYTFRFDGFAPGDYIKLQLNGDPAPAEGASIGGFLFDELRRRHGVGD